MSARILFSTTRRVLTQLRHDRRTVEAVRAVSETWKVMPTVKAR